MRACGGCGEMIRADGGCDCESRAMTNPTDAPLMTVDEFADGLDCLNDKNLKIGDKLDAAYRRAISEVERLTEELDVYRERVAGASLENTTLRSEVERVTKERDAAHLGRIACQRTLNALLESRGAVRGDAAIREDAQSHDSGCICAECTEPCLECGRNKSDHDKETNVCPDRCGYFKPPVRSAPAAVQPPADPLTPTQAIAWALNPNRTTEPPADREPPHEHKCANYADVAGAICGKRGFCKCECGATMWSTSSEWEPEPEVRRPAPADEQEFEKALYDFGTAHTLFVQAKQTDRDFSDKGANYMAARTEVMRLYRERGFVPTADDVKLLRHEAKAKEGRIGPNRESDKFRALATRMSQYLPKEGA